MTPTSLTQCILASKEALGGDAIQLWQLHHSDGYGGSSDEFCELLVAANQAVEDGHVLKIGLCNCSTEHVQTAYDLLGDTLSTVSNKYNLFDRTTEKLSPKERGKPCAKSNKHGVVSLCQKLGITFLAYACVGGLETRDGRKDLCASFPRLKEIGESTNVVACPHHVAMAFLYQKWRGTVVPLVGVRDAIHLNGLKDFRHVVLTEEEMREIDGMTDRCNKKRKR